MHNTINLAINKVARNLSVDRKLVEQVYKSYWLFIKEHISSLPLRELSREEYDSTVSNINLPFLGKLYVDYNKLEKYHKERKLYRDVKSKENKANGLSGSCD
jgi:hypothetical protein